MMATHIIRVTLFAFSIAILSSLSNIAPAAAVVRAQDAPSIAIETIAGTIDAAVAEVAGVLVAGPAADDTLSVEQDADWERFTAGSAEIWLPPSFVGGDLEQDLDLILDSIRAFGPDFEIMVEAIEQNPSAFVLFAVDTERVESGVMTNVNITTERVLSFMTTELYLESVAGLLPDPFEVLEQERIVLPEFEDASRAIGSVNFPGAPTMMQVMYVIKDGANTVWAITFTAPESAFDTWLPVFERSVESFTVSPD
jgi:hypothetical protein